jgi:uncharacterized lipoprotein
MNRKRTEIRSPDSEELARLLRGPTTSREQERLIVARNPTEKIWDQLKDVVCNKVFDWQPLAAPESKRFMSGHLTVF